MPDEDRFRFDLRDEEQEVSFNEEELKQRMATLNRRLSFLMLVLPLLLAIALYAGYQDLAQRTAKTQSAELRSVERVSAEADQKMTAFETRMADFESVWTAKMDSEQKSAQALKDELRKSVTEIDKLGVSKAEKKELAEAAARTETALTTIQKELQTLQKDHQTLGREVQALAPFREELGSAAALRNDIGSLSTRLQRLENVLGKDLTGMAGYLERTKSDLEKIKTDLSHLQARKIDREAAELESLKTKRLYQMALDQEVARIDKTLTGLQRRLEQLEKAWAARSGSSSHLPSLTGGIKEQAVE